MKLALGQRVVTERGPMIFGVVVELDERDPDRLGVCRWGDGLRSAVDIGFVREAPTWAELAARSTGR